MEACSPIIWEGSSAIFSSLAPVSRGSWLRRLGELDEPDRYSICWMGVRSYRLCDNPSKVGQLEADRNRSDIPSILYRRSTPLLAVSSATGAADIAAHTGRRKQCAHATAAINTVSSISVTAYGRRPPQQFRQLGENHRYRGLPRRIASDFLFVLFFGEQLDYRLPVGFLGHTF